MRLLLSLLAALLLPALPVQAAQPAHVEESSEASPVSGRYLLMDANGRAVTNEDFPGKFQLISFGYTFCPDICPTTLAEMSVILYQLGERAEALQPIFVTVDPERDTAATLREYTAFFHPRIIGLTGSPALVKRAADNFRVRYEKVREPGQPAGQYAVDHSAGMYLLGPDGRYLRKFAYGVAPTAIAAQIGEIIQATPLRSR